MKKTLYVALLLLASSAVFGQFAWWNTLHNWDGYTPWTEYMVYSHGYLGPNALPIPIVQEDLKNFARTSSQISMRGDDQFLNWHNEVQLVSGRTQFHIIHQSVEAFRTTNTIRDRRVSRGESGQGIQAGDVIVNVSNMLWEQEKGSAVKRLFFTTHLKTAAGPLNNARFTDAPGYAFFFSGSYHPKVTFRTHVFVDAGFQVYQTFWADYPQNDGFLFNIRGTQDFGKTAVHGGIRTFTGYFRQGDWPRIVDLGLDRKTGDNSRIELSWTFGVNDYPFSFLVFCHQWQF